MYSTSAAFKAAVRGSHTVAIQVDAYSSGTLIASDIQVESGSVTASAASGVRRQLSLTVSDRAVSPFGASPISVYGVELHVARGITLLDGTTELVPLGVFRVESMTSPRQGEVQIVAPDRSAKIIDAKFLIPTMSNTGLGLAAQISALVTDVYTSGVSVTNVDVPATSVPWLLWDSERWDACQKLATAVGAVVYFDVAGNVVLRLAPTIADAVAWYVNEGAQGVLIDASREITRAETYNVVVAVGERSDGVVPARAVAEDNDTTSATYVGGPFGYVPFFFSSPLITTSGGATTVADALLARKRSLGRECILSCVPNPALDVGDVIGVRFPDGSLERHVVDQLTIPLDATSPMTITTRTPAPYLVITDVPIPLSPIPDGSFTPGADYGTVTDYGTLLDPPAYDTTPPGLYDSTPTPPLDTTPVPLDPFSTGSGGEPPPDWYGDGHKVVGAAAGGDLTTWDNHALSVSTTNSGALHAIVIGDPIRLADDATNHRWSFHIGAASPAIAGGDSWAWGVKFQYPDGQWSGGFGTNGDNWTVTVTSALSAAFPIAMALTMIDHGASASRFLAVARGGADPLHAGTWDSSSFSFMGTGGAYGTAALTPLVELPDRLDSFGHGHNYHRWQSTLWISAEGGGGGVRMLGGIRAADGTWSSPTNEGQVPSGAYANGSIVEFLSPATSGDHAPPLAFRVQGIAGYDPGVTFGSAEITGSAESFYLHYIPQTLPEAIVKLDGTTLNPADNKYNIDYSTGLFTILPAMSATLGQVVTVQYKSDGTVT
jgi:hypothetical protein